MHSDSQRPRLSSLPCRMCVDCLLCMNEDWAWPAECLGCRASLDSYKATGPAQVRYTVHNTWLAELQVWLVHFIHLGAEAAYWQSPRAASCYEIQEMPHLAQSNARDPVKSAEFLALAAVTSLRAWACQCYCNLTNLDKSTFLVAGILCISLLPEVILWFSNFGVSPWMPALLPTPSFEDACRAISRV